MQVVSLVFYIKKVFYCKLVSMNNIQLQVFLLNTYRPLHIICNLFNLHDRLILKLFNLYLSNPSLK